MLFRSEKVNYYEIRIPHDSAWHVMNLLGPKPLLQFIDCNQGHLSAEIPFGDRLARCSDLESKITEFQRLFDHFKCTFTRCEDVPLYMEGLSDNMFIQRQSGDIYLTELEQSVNKEFSTLSGHKGTLTKLLTIISEA